MAPTSFSTARLHSHADLVGATASTICMIHCLLTPVVISLFPSLVPYLPGDSTFHRLLAITIVIIGVVGFVPGYLIHRRTPLLALVAVGISMVLYVACSGEQLSSTVELILSVSGSFLLIAAHLLNRSFCRRCRACKMHAEPCATTKIS